MLKYWESKSSKMSRKILQNRETNIMASIKKVRPIRIIGEEEFIDAFNMNNLWRKKEENRSTQNIADYQKYEKVFEEAYGASWFVVLYEIFKWHDYIFKGQKTMDKPEAYKNYAECIYRNQREPLKTKNGKIM